MIKTTLSRRAFQRKVGEGMLTAAIGTSLAHELGISTAIADDNPARLSFGNLDLLVDLMEETPPDELQKLAVQKLKSGSASLDELMRAAALANARSFGGADYIGMHTLMAMKPAMVMAQQMPTDRAALAILKILHRNTSQIQSDDSRGETMHPVTPALLPIESVDTAKLLNKAVREGDRQKAEEILAAIAAKSPDQAFNDLLETIEENTQVHGVVFAHRSWEAIDLVGPEFATTMLRQSLRRHATMEKRDRTKSDPKRKLFPQLLDEFGLVGFSPGIRNPDDGWMKEMMNTIFSSSPEQSARAVASALKEGISPAAIGEAISLAANQLVLRDVGRVKENRNPDKEPGTTHGDSIGVHASDSAHAWRGMAGISNPSNTVACLILGAWQVAHDRTSRGGDFIEWEPRPVAEQLAKVSSTDPKTLLGELDGAIREDNQDQACAVTRRYGDLGHPERPLLDILLRYAVSEDGALHGEKYYLTTTSDFGDTRKAFRWNHLVGLARITASEHGLKAAGYNQACELLGVEV